MSENNKNITQKLGTVYHFNKDITNLEKYFKNLLTQEKKLKQEHLNQPLKFLSYMEKCDDEFMEHINKERKDLYYNNTLQSISSKRVAMVYIPSFNKRPIDSKLSIENKRLILTKTIKLNEGNNPKSPNLMDMRNVKIFVSPINNKKYYTRNTDITDTADIHTKAYLKFLHTIGIHKNKNGNPKVSNSFIILMMTLVYFSLLRDIDYNSMEIDELAQIYKNVARVHSKIHINDKYKLFKYYSTFISHIIKESVNILLHTLSKKIKDCNFKTNNKNGDHIIDIKIIKHFLFFTREINLYTKHSYNELMSREKLEEIKNSLLVCSKKHGIDKKPYKYITNLAEKSLKLVYKKSGSVSRVTNRDLEQLKSLRHVDGLNK